MDTGKVSPYLVRQARAGAIVRLGGVEGTFVLPDPLPERLLFISAGSGITPIMSMLRSLAGRGAMSDVVLLHSARTHDDVIFGPELRRLAASHSGLRVHEQLTGEMGRMGPQDLDSLCPDWRDREAFISGPAEMLDALGEHWDRHGGSRRPHMERFQPLIGSEDAEHGDGGTIRFTKSGVEATSDGADADPRGRRERRARRCPTAAAWASATPASASSAPAVSATCARARCRARPARSSAPA